MEEYYFLFGLALIYTIFASIQDIRKREVSNWLNFSLVTFGLIYRLVYSIITLEYNFFILGLLGFGVFFLLANLMYYGKVFAGGDAKLLIGFGVILPYNNYYSLLFTSMGFIIVLFFFGTIYSLLYSGFLAYKNKTEFLNSFKYNLKKKKIFVFAMLIFEFIFIIELFLIDFWAKIIWLGFIIILIMPFLYIYLLSIEKSCMVVLTHPRDLTEGDWLEKDVRVKNKVIRKSVHGLSYKEIVLLRKAGKKILIKQGIPFVPAFLFALIFMVFFYLVLGFDFLSLFEYLF